MNHRDRLKGIFLIAIALAFGLGAMNYSIGKVERAGTLVGLIALFVLWQMVTFVRELRAGRLARADAGEVALEDG